MNQYKSRYTFTILLHALLLLFPCQATQIANGPKDDSSISSLDNTANLGEQNPREPENRFLVATQKGNLNTLKKIKEQGYEVDFTDQDGNTSLYWAIKKGVSPEVIFWLVSVAEANINLKSKKEQYSPFLLAAKQGNLLALCILYAKGVNMKTTDQHGNNALHLAAMYASESRVINWLIDTAKFSIEAKNNKKRTPFLCAARNGNLPALKILRAKGANLEVRDLNRNNALHLAAYYAPEGKGIEWLLDTAQIPIEAEGNFQSTAFLCAVEKGNLPALNILKSKGANLCVRDKNGNNALHYAVLYDPESKALEWLIDTAKIYIDSKGFYQKNPFLSAVQSSNLPALKFLEERGANLNCIDKNGYNALHYATEYSKEKKVIEWLIDKAKIDVESKGQNQKTPFICAAQYGNLPALEILLAKGASVTATDQDGSNPLHYATLEELGSKVIEWLIVKAKIDIESKGPYQKTAFLVAAKVGNLPALKILQVMGAKVNATDQDGDNALHLAAYFSSKGKGVKWLIDKAKIDIEARGFLKRTAFLCAAKKGNLPALKILKAKGANLYIKDENANNALALAKKYSGSHMTIQWLKKQLNQ